MARLRVTTANICGNPRRPKAAVRRRMRRALMLGGATFGQEVARSTRWRRGNYSAEWHQLAEHLGRVTIGGPREVPISLPAGWPVRSSSVELVHAGRRGVSPARYLTTACTVVDGILVAFVNVHPVSKPRRGVPASSWRIARWAQYHDRLREHVAELVAEGYTVLVGGDLNRVNVPAFNARQRTLIAAGLDHLWIVPARGVAVVDVQASKIRRTLLMDHPILSAVVELRPRLVS